MEKFTIIYKKRFQKKLFNLLHYLETNWGLFVVDDFIIKLKRKTILIQNNPLIGYETSIKGVRTVLVSKHNRLYYRIKNGKVEILNLYDTRTNPSKNIFNK